MSVFRVENTEIDGITTQNRQELYTNIPCRVYNNPSIPSSFTDTSAEIPQKYTLACDLSVNVKEGDELFISRMNGEKIKGFVGNIVSYCEPYAKVSPRISHKKITLSGVVRNA